MTTAAPDPGTDRDDRPWWRNWRVWRGFAAGLTVSWLLSLTPDSWWQ